MTKEELCAVAFSVIDDPEAALVLQDALLERGENFSTYARRVPRSLKLGLRGAQSGRAMIVAAVLVFETWPERWPLVDRLARRLPDITFTMPVRVLPR